MENHRYVRTEFKGKKMQKVKALKMSLKTRSKVQKGKAQSRWWNHEEGYALRIWSDVTQLMLDSTQHPAICQSMLIHPGTIHRSVLNT